MRTTKPIKKFVFFGVVNLDEMNQIDYPENSRVISVVPAPKNTLIRMENNPNFIVIVEIEPITRGEIDV